VRQHVEATSTIDFVPHAAEITTSYKEGSLQRVKMHDGSFIKLHKLATNWDPFSVNSARNALAAAKEKGEILTGLLYIDAEPHDLHDTIQTSDLPLNTLGKSVLCPGSAMLAELNDELR
jgi:2-oxoglutarate ferredoxin oxidoreductase subunit beta